MGRLAVAVAFKSIAITMKVCGSLVALGLLLMSNTSTAVNQPAITFTSTMSFEGVPNPRLINTAGDWTISNHLWARLVQLGELGQESGDLAKSWKRSLDGLTWTFELLENLKWSDGSPITAKQVAESLELSLQGTAHTNLKSYVKRVFAKDETHIVFELSSLPQNFLYSLAFADYAITDGPVVPGTYPNSKHQITRTSGPYKLISAKPGEIVLEPNPYSPHRPKIPVHARLLSCNSTESFFDTLANGNVDVAMTSGEAEPGNTITSKALSDNFQVTKTSPEWTIALEAGRSGLKIPAPIRRFLQRKLWNSLAHSKTFGSAPTTGLRPPFLFGGLSENEWLALLKTAPDHIGTNNLRPLELFIPQTLINRKSYLSLKATLQELGLKFKETIFDYSRSDSPAMKRLKAKDYDFAFTYEGVNDPDPDSAWRYMMEYYPGEKKLVTKEELDKALLEPDRKKREAMYKEFEKRNVENPYILPIRMVGSKVFIKPPVLPPEEGQFEWGIQLWKFRMQK